MSDPVLHIKDSYYFEVPKVLLPAQYRDKSEFPDVWVKNDEQFQGWQAEELYEQLVEFGKERKVTIPELGTEPDSHGHGTGLLGEWRHWQHTGANHANFAKPMAAWLDGLAAELKTEWQAIPEEQRPAYDKFLGEREAAHGEGVWFARLFDGKEAEQQWESIKKHVRSKETVGQFKQDPNITWSAGKLAAYNDHLSGKILLQPQPFGDLKNLYEPEPGSITITKFMVIEVFVAILLFVLFSWVAGRIRSGMTPKGRLWNFVEVFLLFIRDQIARPAIGAHHDEHEEDHTNSHPTGVAEGHGVGGAGIGGAPAEVDDIHHHDHKPKKGHAHHHHNPYADADRFVPLLWTIFFFVLGCNLFGMLPWLGSPTGSWAVTMALAGVTFLAVCIGGMLKFGVIGFFANQVPTMDLPLPLAILLKPMIFGIEIMGLLIKHLVLSIRLLANMVAGHLVILGLMGLAFGAQAALTFTGPDAGALGWLWWPVAIVTVLSATAFNVLELFVAFLQAYVFTFLSALFIGAAVHKH